jgi:hypothetical protein
VDDTRSPRREVGRNLAEVIRHLSDNIRLRYGAVRHFSYGRQPVGVIKTMT